METPEEGLPKNIYDRIFKENAETIFIPLIEQRLKLQIKAFRPLKDQFLSTIEREVDFLYEVDTDAGESLLLHIEFQTQNDPEMLYRVEEYHGLARRKYRKRIEHVVIYLGTKKPRMRARLREEELFQGFEMISIHDLDTTDLLTSQVPEVVILAILSRYEPDRAEAVLRLILAQLKALCQTPAELNKYIFQLLILSRLRKLESLTTEIVAQMPITYDITTDGLYQKGIVIGREEGREEGIKKGIKRGREQGIKKGREKGLEQGLEQGIEQGIEKGIEKAVRKLLIAGVLSPEEIAGSLEIDLEYVMKIQAQIDTVG